MNFLRILFAYLAYSASSLFYYLLGGESQLVLVIYIGLNCIFISYVIFMFFRDSKMNLIKAKRFEGSLISNAKVSIIVTDFDGVITHFSNGAEELLGYKSEELVGLQTPAIIHEYAEIVQINNELNELYNENLEPGFSTFTRRLRFQDKDEQEWTYKRKDGSTFPVILSISSIKNIKGDITGYMGIATDITNIREKERELELAHIKVQESDRVKSIFLSNMSHEFRTPLYSILGMTTLLKESNLSPVQDGYLKFIKDSAIQLQNLLVDILDFSNLQTLNISVKLKIVEIQSINSNFKNLLTLLSKDKNLIVDFIEYNLPNAVRIDALRLRQVVTILIANALRNTNFGSVKIYCEYQDGFLTYIVEDTGLGISEKDVSLILEKDHTNIRNVLKSNFVLGISMVKNIVELMEGRLDILSTNELGTKISIKIPTKAYENTDESENQKNFKGRLLGKNFLIVEDNLIGQKIIAKYLEMTGATYKIAGDGSEAVEFARNEKFDLILMDYQLPILDGIEATLSIRQFDQKTPIIALTANAQEEDRNKCLLSGMNDFLAKPVEINFLVQTILKNIKD